MAAIPIVVSIPLGATVNNIARVPFYNDATVFRVAGSLQSLTSGTVSVSVKKNGTEIGSLSWSSSGVAEDDVSDRLTGVSKWQAH